MMNPYDILGIPPTATDDEVLRAYRKTARETHPDRGGDPAMFRATRDAYDRIVKARADGVIPEYTTPGDYATAPRSAPWVHLASNISKVTDLHPLIRKRWSPQFLAAIAAFTVLSALGAWLAIEHIPDAATILTIVIATGWAGGIAAGLADNKLARWLLAGGAALLVALAAFLAVFYSTITAVTLFAATVMVLISTRMIREEDVLVARMNVASALVDQGYRISGQPGTGLDDGKFSEEAAGMGVRGEMMTADALDRLLLIPSARIFHSLGWPGGGSNADLDHAVAAGQRVAFIDSKYWQGGHYTLGPDGRTIYCNGKLVSDLTLVTSMNAYTMMLPKNIEVRGWLILHRAIYDPDRVPDDYLPDRPDLSKQERARMWRKRAEKANRTPLTVDTSNAQQIIIATPDEAIDQIGGWLVSEGGRIDRYLLDVLDRNVK